MRREEKREGDGHKMGGRGRKGVSLLGSGEGERASRGKVREGEGLGFGKNEGEKATYLGRMVLLSTSWGESEGGERRQRERLGLFYVPN